MSALRSRLSTACARVRNPDRTSWKSTRNAARSSRNVLPTSLPTRRNTNAPPIRSRWNDRPPPVGRANHLMAGLETAAAIRLGASRKSSALAVGGVSSTMRS